MVVVWESTWIILIVGVVTGMESSHKEKALLDCHQLSSLGDYYLFGWEHALQWQHRSLALHSLWQRTPMHIPGSDPVFTSNTLSCSRHCKITLFRCSDLWGCGSAIPCLLMYQNSGDSANAWANSCHADLSVLRSTKWCIIVYLCEQIKAFLLMCSTLCLFTVLAVKKLLSASCIYSTCI